MIFSTSFLNKIWRIILLVLILSNNSGARQLQSSAEPQASLLPVFQVVADLPAPQVMERSAVTWQVVSTDIGEAAQFSFELMNEDGRVAQVQKGSSSEWRWCPDTAGTFRVRVSARAEAGHWSEGEWSAPYVIVPPLLLEGSTVDKTSPQMAGTGPIVWRIAASGGVAPLTYDVELEKNGTTSGFIGAPAGILAWTPQAAGSYRLRTLVSDVRGNTEFGEWSQPFEIVPALTVEKISVDRPSPQMAGTGPVTWTVTTTGGVGQPVVHFEFEPEGGPSEIVQSGAAKNWIWPATEPGSYRVRVLVEDLQGNQVESHWYGFFKIAPSLRVQAPVPDKAAPQAALTKPITWVASATGGVVPLSYQFEWSRDGGDQQTLESGPLSDWNWAPAEAGDYKVRVWVTDLRGNQAVSAWADPYRVAPPLSIEAPIAGISAPQMVATVAVPWTVNASGGVGARTYMFELARDAGKVITMQSGPASTWSWQPVEAGVYRVRSLMSDALGNQVSSDWSAPFGIEPKLQIRSFSTDRSSPQAAQTMPVVWNIRVSGGVGEKSYRFQMACNGDEARTVQEGLSASWSWRPLEAGDCRSRVMVKDSLGNQLQGDWSPSYQIVPPLIVSVPEPNNPAEQYLVGTQVRWKTRASGGVGKRTIRFLFEEIAGQPDQVQEGSEAVWLWRIEKPGYYRVSAVAIDRLGNKKESDWSDWKEIRTPLALDSLTSSLLSPQPTLEKGLYWRAKISGGIGDVTCEFRTIRDGVEAIEQQGGAPRWNWSPAKAGHYRVKVRVLDSANHLVESDWSDDYQITPVITPASRVALLPIENLTDGKAPLQQIVSEFSDQLNGRLPLLGEKKLEQFMRAHRMRYSGGIDAALAAALREETGTEAVFITSLETWHETPPLRISLFSRLVTTGPEPRIIWMDSIGLSGDEAAGLLGLGKIKDMHALLNQAIGKLITSFQSYLAAKDPSFRHTPDQQVRLINGASGTAENALGSRKARYNPQFSFRSSSFDPTRKIRLALIPFLNVNARKHAEKIVTLNTLKQLYRYENIEVFEPGMIREILLRYRMILQSGPSLATSDILADAGVLGADIILSGKVFDYQDAIGESKVDFSLQAFDGHTREVVWTSHSYATGKDGVYLFDLGKISSTQELTSLMTQAAIKLLEE
ncbi:hypothetical protein [Geopsychrobacter electrodiphilus]|uniref:hypothetical protein n=1 Tax=Geopsychrobacter electrodiphilus TaxID=225196 RepID=UPI00037C94EB|nr:hypothetical protein [Geopsychrobacter electrodiphilus]